MEIHGQSWYDNKINCLVSIGNELNTVGPVTWADVTKISTCSVYISN